MFRKIGIFLAVFIALAFIALWIIHEPLPKGTTGPKADALAQKMVQAVNKVAWDKTRYVGWSFPGGHDYLWDKNRNFVRVRWNEKEVLLDTKNGTGRAFENGTDINGAAKNEALQTATDYFNNDSWWLNAPVKAFDAGVMRSMIELGNGEQGLLVTYSSGGSTPGDSYLWKLDDAGLPTSYQMWVKIIPIGGLEWSWDNWTTLPSGAKIATLHQGLLDISITNLKSGATLAEMGEENNVFKNLEQ